MNPKIAQSLLDIVEHCDELAGYLEGMTVAEFHKDGAYQRMVERLIFVLGEAVVRIRDADEAYLKEIPSSRQIIGMRNRLAHDYDTINVDLLWMTATQHAPTFVRQLRGRN